MQANVPGSLVIDICEDRRDSRDDHCACQVQPSSSQTRNVNVLTIDDTVDEREVEGDQLDDGLFGKQDERPEQGDDNELFDTRNNGPLSSSKAHCSLSQTDLRLCLPRLLEDRSHLFDRALLDIHLLTDLVRLSLEQSRRKSCTVAMST